MLKDPTRDSIGDLQVTVLCILFCTTKLAEKNCVTDSHFPTVTSSPVGRFELLTLAHPAHPRAGPHQRASFEYLNNRWPVSLQFLYTDSNTVSNSNPPI